MKEATATPGGCLLTPVTANSTRSLQFRPGTWNRRASTIANKNECTSPRAHGSGGFAATFVLGPPKETRELKFYVAL